MAEFTIPILNVDNLFPISLQEYCYLFIIGYLDQYPPEYIALLPTRLRQNLLARLPAIDIQLMENTAAVVENINAEMFYLHPDDVRKMSSTSISFKPTPVGYKEQYLDNCMRELFWIINNHTERVTGIHVCKSRHMANLKPLEALLCLRHFNLGSIYLDEGQLKSVQNILKHCQLSLQCPRFGGLIVPERHQLTYTNPYHYITPDPENKYISQGYPWIDGYDHLVACRDILVEIFHVHPKVVPIDFHNYHGINEYKYTLKPLLSQTEGLKFVCMEQCEGNYKLRYNQGSHASNLKDFFKMIVVNNGNVKHITVDTEEKFYIDRQLMQNLLQCITPFYSPGFEKFVNEPNFVPWNTLETLSIGQLPPPPVEKIKRKLIIKDEFIFQLAAIIANQKCLRKASLFGSVKYTQASEDLMAVLVVLVQSPQFELLSLGPSARNSNQNDREISVESFTRLLIQFLTNPAAHDQHLYLDDVMLVHTKSTKKRLKRISSELANIQPSPPLLNQKKKLRLNVHGYEKKMFQLLSALPPVCLDSLNLTIQLSRPNVLQDLPNIQTKHLLVRVAGFGMLSGEVLKVNIGEQLKCGIQSSFLTKLTLDLSSVYKTSFAEQVAHAISDHAKYHKTLSCIQIDGVLAYTYPSLELVFISFFDLAMEVELDIHVKNWRMGNDQFVFLHSLWMNGGYYRQIHELKWHLRNALEIKCIEKLSEIVTILSTPEVPYEFD